MSLNSPKFGSSLSIAALFLMTMGAAAQNQTVQNGSGETSTSLPDAPVPQNPYADAPTWPAQSVKPEPVTIKGTPKRFLKDQAAIWTSPLAIKPGDLVWLLPLAATTGVLIGSDHHTMTADVHINASDQKTFKTLSDAGVAALAAFPASMFVYSSITRDAPQAYETSLLAGEAAGDALAVNEVFKLVSRRDRPTVNDAQGDFFNSTWGNSSFGSNHAAASWAMAAVVGDEYPGWLTRTAVYGLAAGVSVSRVLAEQHFPSDVLVGSATGWLIGHYVYRAHHNFRLNPFDSTRLPDEYGAPRPHPVAAAKLNIPPDPIVHRPARPLGVDVDPDTIGSSKVPMDSWVYPALERLGALGLIPGQSLSIRPWTRQECLRQLKVAEELISRKDLYGNGLRREAARLLTDLHYELEREPDYYASLDLDSVYGRVGTIAGPALADSYHFGQTWWNDMGRPLGRGTSAELGYEARAHYGRLYFYSREEAQHGPGNPANSQEVTDLINVIDRSQAATDPLIAPVEAHAAYSQMRAIELYGGVAFAGNAISLGKQEIYWGPTTMGPIAFSSNAEPTYNARFESTRPHPLPFFPSLGTYRFDLVIGKLSGHSYPARPWFNGQKVDFNFGDNFELSFTRWSVFWGVGHPITFHSLKDNIFSFNSTGNDGCGGCAGYGDRTDPGDRKSNFDFTWRLPYMSKLVTLYADAYSDDDPSPIDAPRRALWNPGIYFARLPWLPHMDFRAEAVSSQGLATEFGPYHFFTNSQYLDSNTNKGFLLGNAIGRDGRAVEGKLGYWISAKSRIEGGYRQNKISNGFYAAYVDSAHIARGGTISDGFVNGSFAFNNHWQAETFVQYERFLIPAYMPGAHNNTSAWLRINWTPDLHIRH